MEKRFFHGIFLVVCAVLLMANGCDDSKTPETSGGAETSGITILPKGDDYTFTRAYVGYTTISEGTIQITNNGGAAISVDIELKEEGTASNFSLSTATLNIAGKGKGTFKIIPKTGLAKGTYEATVTITVVDADDIDPKTLGVSFTVDDNQHLYIAFGQSNMQGPAPIRDQDKTGVDYTRWRTLNVVKGLYGGASAPAGISREKGQWYDAIPPLIISGNLKHWQNDFTTGMGPTDYFGRYIVNKTNGTNLKVGVVAVANGDWALASFRKEKAADYYSASPTIAKESGRPSDTEKQGWTRYTTGTDAGYASPYDAIIKNAKIAQEAGWVIKGIIVHQGESGRGQTDISWEQMLKEIYNDILADLELEADSIPILLGQTFNGGTGNTNGYLNTDNRIQTIIPKAYVISSAGLNKGRPVNDNIHFGSEDMETLGTRYGEKMWDLLYK